MSRIFINYRRSLSQHAALRIRDLLARHFGRSVIFLDDHAIEKGADFPETIRQGLESCEVFLPIIGEGWHEASEGAQIRIQSDDDWVRREIATVLQRNASRAAGTREPVLIVPILLDGTAMPQDEHLPADLRRLVNHNAASFRSERDLDAIVAVIEAHLGDPPMGSLGVRLLCTKPDLSKSDRYRFRAPVTRAELEPFVALSDGEPDIALSNPGLTGETRRDLYDQWCQWTADDPATPWTAPGNRTRSFLILDDRETNATWRPIAVSIILPLSMRGGAMLAGTSIEAVQDPARKRTAVTLEADDLARADSRCLLVDTWAVGRAGARGTEANARRINHHYWAVALMLRHLAEFWSPADGKAVSLMVEPNERVARVLLSLGFERRDRNAKSGDLYFLDYPMNAYRYSEEARHGVERVLDAVRTAKAFEIVRSSAGKK